MGRDLAIDLGSANTLVYRQGEGIVYRQPTVAAVETGSGRVVGVGEEAWVGSAGRDVVAVRPLRQGVMTEYEVGAAMLQAVFRRIAAARFPRPRVVVCVPSASSPVERRAVEDAIAAAGGRHVVLVEEALAAAIGAGLPIHEPIGNLVVDVGGGISEMAVVSMGGVVSGRSVPVGGFDLDAAIQDHVRRTYGVAIGDRAAEQVKVAVGTAFPSQHGSAAVVRGRELATGDTVEVTLSEDEVRQAMAEPVARIVEGARRCLAEAPPELTHDILETGVFLTGGGSLLRGLDVLLAQECEVPVHLAERPLETVVIGAGRMLERLAEYRSSFQLVRGHAGGGR